MRNLARIEPPFMVLSMEVSPQRMRCGSQVIAASLRDVAQVPLTEDSSE
jgi:hypothetical protein